jgi:copper(I)-binding protein
MRPSRMLLSAALALVLAACGGTDPELSVEGAWVRSNPNLMGAAYLVITSPTDDELVAASVDPSIAATVEVHEVVTDDGMMRMREVSGITLPAGESVVLEPGGYHLMLLDMPAMLAPGTGVDITLTFTSGTTRVVSAEVRESTVPEDHMHGQHEHGWHEHEHGQHDPRGMPGGHGSEPEVSPAG